MILCSLLEPRDLAKLNEREELALSAVIDKHIATSPNIQKELAGVVHAFHEKIKKCN